MEQYAQRPNGGGGRWRQAAAGRGGSSIHPGLTIMGGPTFLGGMILHRPEHFMDGSDLLVVAQAN